MLPWQMKSTFIIYLKLLENADFSHYKICNMGLHLYILLHIFCRMTLPYRFSITL